mgnify:CR=1 FL=1
MHDKPETAPSGNLLDSSLTWASLVAIAILFFLHPVGTSDLFWQMKAGELIWETNSVPGVDVFSFTAAGKPWHDHEWLANVVYYGAWRTGGFDFLSVLSFAVGLCLVASIYAGARALSRSEPIAVILAFFVCAASAQRIQQFRPELLAFIFFSLLLWILFSASAARRRRLWLIIPMHVLWANFHASAIIGPALIILSGAALILSARQRGREAPFSWRTLLLLSAASAAALAVNPYGPGIYTFPFEHMGHGFSLAVTSDWAKPGWFSPVADISAWGLSAFAAVSLIMGWLAFRRGCLPWPEALVALACLPAGPMMTRFVPFAVIALALFIAACIGCAGKTSPGRESFLRVASVALAFGALLVMWKSGPIHGLRSENGRVDIVLGLPVGLGFHAGDFPVEAADFLERSPIEGRIFNDMSWGGYLIWRMWPGRKVFIDTRTPVYGDSFIKDYSDALFDEERFSLLADKWRITHVLYDLRDLGAPEGPLEFLKNNPRWRPVYSDANSVIFLRLAR